MLCVPEACRSKLNLGPVPHLNPLNLLLIVLTEHYIVCRVYSLKYTQSTHRSRVYIVTCQVHPGLVKRVQCTARSPF